MRPKGMLMALAFVLGLILLAWATGERGPLSAGGSDRSAATPADDRAPAPAGD